MTQVVQSKCPHCQQVLRVPADWLGKSMRCKFCKNTFQATAAPAAAPAKPATPAKPALAKPAAAVQAIQTAPLVAAPVGKPGAAIQSAGAHPAGGNMFDFPEGEEDAHVPSVALPKRKRGRGTLLLVLTFFVLFLIGAGGAAFVVSKVLKNMPPDKGDGKPVANADERERDSKKVTTWVAKGTPDPDERKDKKDPTKTETTPDDKKKKKTPVVKKGKDPNPPSNEPFPRRALLISVNNYLMFNTSHYGSGQDRFKGGYPGSSTSVLRDRLARPPMNFPASQVIELSDGVPADSIASKAFPTQKVILETTIKDFVNSSRAQDRVILLFAGHAAALDGKSYLIPIDGNLADTDTLIPLKWVYDQLAKCKAQQKILVLDVFRFSPSRGFELPGAGEGDEGTVPEGFDKDVLNPPAGIQVWCACQKEQSSVELEGGSAFLQAFCHALQGGPEMAGISSPAQPIPIDAMVTKVNQRLKDLLAPEKRTQVSRLTGKDAGNGPAYDPKEALPAALALKMPADEGGDRAGYAQVNKILDELKMLPPVRETRAGEANLLKAQNLPAFSVKKLDAYKPEGYQTLGELVKRQKVNAEEFAKEFPLRSAVLEAVAALQDSNKIQMREVLPGPVDPKQKAAFLNEQAAPGMSIFMLEQALAKLEAAAADREKETSKRWQANFDYTQARLQSRLVYLFEYSYTLGQIRADNLPELAPGQSGWRIGTGKKIAVTESKAKALSKNTAKLWKKIQDEYPYTPWSLLAQRESMIALGLQWRPKSD